MNAVDTNVLVYSLDVDEPAKQAKAKEAGVTTLFSEDMDLFCLSRIWKNAPLGLA